MIKLLTAIEKGMSKYEHLEALSLGSFYINEEMI